MVQECHIPDSVLQDLFTVTPAQELLSSCIWDFISTKMVVCSQDFNYTPNLKEEFWSKPATNCLQLGKWKKPSESDSACPDGPLVQCSFSLCTKKELVRGQRQLDEFRPGNPVVSWEVWDVSFPRLGWRHKCLAMSCPWLNSFQKPNETSNCS
jgi:hypothetical protein